MKSTVNRYAKAAEKSDVHVNITGLEEFIQTDNNMKMSGQILIDSLLNKCNYSLLPTQTHHSSIF